MTDTIESVLAEIAGDIHVSGSTRTCIDGSLREILELRSDTSLPVYELERTVAMESAFVHRMIFRGKFEGRVSRPERKWYPGGSSAAGFLGWGESLEIVIAEDAIVLGNLGITAEKLGLRLKEILDAPRGADGFSVKKLTTRGSQACPFDDCSLKNCLMIAHSNLDFTVVNTRTGEGIMGPGLIWHLVAEHQFFEGKYSGYRVDPVQLVNVLFG